MTYIKQYNDKQSNLFDYIDDERNLPPPSSKKTRFIGGLLSDEKKLPELCIEINYFASNAIMLN